MRKLILLITLVSVLASNYMFADIYGTLNGKVVDNEGKGLIGATIMVQGTTRGTKVNARDGSFTVTNITAGSYTVLVRYAGKQDYKVNVRISASQVTRINATMKDEAVAIGEVTVTADRVGAAKVDANQVGAINTLSGEDLTRTTASNLAAVVGMSAGVSTSDAGYSIRGSRTSETQIRLDGMNMGNQFSGGFGAAGAAYFPMASTYATEEVQVITGNFAAQYGDVQGGIVNSIMRTGRTDRFEGFIAFTSDLPFLSGYQSSNTEMLYEGGKYRIVNGSGDGAQYLQGHLQNYEAGFGGPLSFVNDKSTFYVTLTNTVRPYSPGYDLRDVNGNSLTRNDVSGTWSRNLEGRLAFGLTNDVKLVLGGKMGLVTAQSGFSTYALEEGTPYINPQTGEIDPVNGVPTANGIVQNEGKTQAVNQFVNNVFARINHTLTDRSFYEFTFSWGQNNEISSRKVIGSDNNYFTGYELMDPVDNWIVDADRWFERTTTLDGRLVGDFAIDWAQSPTSITTSKDGYCVGTFYLVNPLTGYYEGELYDGGTQNPYGIANMALHLGSGLGRMGGVGALNLEYGDIFSGAGHYNLFGLKTGDFTHTLKAGFEASYFIMHKHFNGSPYSTAPTYDIYTDKWNGNIYSIDQAVYDKTSKPMNQFKLAAYIQDQITYKGIVFNPGLRLDIMDPLSKYRVINSSEENGLQFIPISSEVGFADATIKVRVSPRININYPITENSYVSMSYGQFFQSPMANSLYNYFNLEQMRQGIGIGDPNMEPQLTSQYQVEYKNQLTDEFAVSLSVYFKDIYNQLGVIHVQTTPEAYLQWAVSEYGSSKGIEVKLDKSLSDNFGFSLNYALSYLIVTAADAGSNADVIKDPYTGKMAFPLAPYYSSSDVRHRIGGNIFFVLDRDEGPVLFNSRPLQNMVLTLEPVVSSGTPYTQSDIGGTQTSERNVYRLPSYWNVNARLSKSFELKNWFGESMGRSNVEFFVTCDNMFNNRQAVSLYSTTHDPLDGGTGPNTTLEGNFSATPWYKDASKANPASYTFEQYDWYGNRLYSAASDFDGNGIVTQAEKYEAYKRYYEQVSIQGRGTFRAPIRFRAGLVVRF